MVQQILKETSIPYHFISADESQTNQSVWIDQQWEVARLKLKQKGASEFLLVIDEIQKIDDWSKVVKGQWDRDSRTNTALKVILLGSSRLLLEKGLTESLAGRFERIFMHHWSYREMQSAFGLTPEEYVWFGGYPGAIPLTKEEDRWKDYIRNALIETTISKDILQLSRIRKPALLKRLFEFSCMYSGKILSYTKMLGQLVDAGNTTTLAHYLELLGSAGLVTGIEKYSGSLVRTRSSSPKLQVLNTALLSAYQVDSLQTIRMQPDRWGHHVESTVGAHLATSVANAPDLKLFYWRHRNNEVDFVLQKGEQVIGLEVKSGPSGYHSGMAAFQSKYQPYKMLLVGPNGMPWQEFLLIDPNDLF